MAAVNVGASRRSRTVSMTIQAQSCTVGDCKRALYARGYCNAHYQNRRRMHGMKKLTAQERFWSKVGAPDQNGCWIWRGKLKNNGYAQIVANGRQFVAHVFSYRLMRGLIPKGKELDHTCRNRSCVNPAHLEPVTHRENVLRGMGLAAKCARRSSCKNGHPFTADNTKLRGHSRVCITCEHVRNNERWKRHKGAHGTA